MTGYPVRPNTYIYISTANTRRLFKKLGLLLNIDLFGVKRASRGSIMAFVSNLSLIFFVHVTQSAKPCSMNFLPEGSNMYPLGIPPYLTILTECLHHTSPAYGVCSFLNVDELCLDSISNFQTTCRDQLFSVQYETVPTSPELIS